MMRIVEARRPKPLQFIVNRFVRIAPVYYLCTLIFFVVAMAVPSSSRGDATVGVLLKSLLFLPHGDAPFYPLLFVGWTLNYEAYFYALLAVLLFAPISGFRMLGAMALLLFVPVALTRTGAFAQQPVSFYGALMVFEFVIGMGLALIYPQLRRVPPIAGATAILAGLLGMIVGDWFPEAERLLTYGMPATLVVTAALVFERHGLRARSRLALTWGAVSYSLYVTHPLVVSAFNLIAKRFIMPQSLEAVGFVLLAIVGAFLFAYVTYRGFERPVDGMLRQLSGRAG